MASSSSVASDSQYLSQWKYDVFLSFRGEDTRETFTGHLYEGLKNRGIYTFQDDKRLEQGDSIPKELMKAIEESQVALLVFSKNYATSSWCLSELVKIMECKEKNRQTVIPIFYHVDSSDVRYQRKSFVEAFAKHELRFKDDVEGMQKVQGWKTALTAAANLKGCDIRDRIESDCIQDIVDQVLSKLWKASVSFLSNVVGINTHLEKVNSLLDMEVNDVRIVGIWGMGGIGKTTIARAIFDTLSPQFDGSCFLADIKENKGRLHSLQNILLSELLRKKDDYVHNEEDGKRMIAHRLRSKKVLIVLDDIDHRDHLDYLAGDLCWFNKGSRIIVTTRDKHLLDVRYEVTTLLKHDALKLFHQYAFKEEVPVECFELSLEVIDHAKGLPLALKVWGSLLHKRDIIEWRSAIEQMKITSNSEIVEKLKISYDGLETIQQDMFLDIACFFRGKTKDKTMPILESCYSGATNIGLSVLIDKSLVFISKSELGESDTIQMHDLIEDMGKYIVKLRKNTGERSRLWDVEDIKEVMLHNTGTMAVEVIWISYIGKLWFSKEAMKNMQMLRILSIQSYYAKGIEDSKESDGSIDYLPNNLCWFALHGYPWKLLPQNFNPTKLVYIDLRGSSLHHLWNETKQLPSLRRLDLSSSKSLKSTPDFTGMPNLECLDLSKCTSLKEVHNSLRCSRKLIELNLSGCKSLERFPYVNVESLKYMDIGCCSSLKKFPEFFGIMKSELKIEVQFSMIRELPSSFILPQWSHLTELYLREDMNNLVSLPSSICELKELVKLSVSMCLKLETLPEGIGDLEKLKELDARYTLITRPPSSIIRLNKLKSLTFAKKKSEDRANFVFPQVNEGLVALEELDLSFCNLIDGGLPEDIGSLSSLKELYLRGNNFEHLPRSIAQLGALQSLDLSGCKRLKELPEAIGDLERLEWLDARYTLISRPPSSIVRLNKLKALTFAKGESEDRANFVFPQVNEGLVALEELHLSCCNLIDGGLPEDIGSLSSLKKLYLRGNNFEHLPRSIAQLGALQSLDLSGCKRLKELPCFTGMTNLDTLNLSYCKLIDGGLLEDIGCLSSLKQLYLSGNNFEHLPQSIAQLGALQSSDLSDCMALKELPDWSNDWLCNSLFWNISSLQPDISASYSLSLRVFKSCWYGNMNIPSWFHHQVQDTSGSVNLPANWYVSDNFLGFAVCYTGELNNDITAHLIPLCDDGTSRMTQKFSLSIDSQYGIKFFLVPFAGLWDASKANGKTPNDYGCFRLVSTREMIEFRVKRKFGVRLFYKEKVTVMSRIEEATVGSRDEEATVAALSHCCNFL